MKIKALVWQVYVTDGPMAGTEFWTGIEGTAQKTARKLRKQPSITPSSVVVSSVYLEAELAVELLRQYSSTDYAF